MIACAMETIGIDSILLGSDYPYEDVTAEIDFIKSLAISEDDKDKIF